MLCPTPEALLCDERGRPSFLWDNELTLDDLRLRLRDADPAVAAYWVGTVMRQARPDDAIVLVGVERMRALWPLVQRHLGRERPFWSWYLDKAR